MRHPSPIPSRHNIPTTTNSSWSQSVVLYYRKHPLEGRQANKLVSPTDCDLQCTPKKATHQLFPGIAVLFSMVDLFSSCTDSCGWIAALIAALSYGSFGVPVKATKHIDVHPFVLQSYKTFIVFLMSWGVTWLGADVGFTKWGLLSGLLWVVGGTGGELFQSSRKSSADKL